MVEGPYNVADISNNRDLLVFDNNIHIRIFVTRQNLSALNCKKPNRSIDPFLFYIHVCIELLICMSKTFFIERRYSRI